MAHKLSFFIISTLFTGLSLASENAKPNFELWNKAHDSVFYALANDEQALLKGPFNELQSGKTAQSHINITKPTLLAVSMAKIPTSGQKIDIFTFAPNKTIYVRVNYLPEKNITQVAK